MVEETSSRRISYLKGRIERITYTNEENGYTVARVQAEDRSDLVTAAGRLAAPNPGEVLEMKGEWVNHPRYGRQFKIRDYKRVSPATVHGIEKYLGSGLIKGIGPVMAKRIVSLFGDKSLDIIENDSERLSEVGGIGKRRIGMIRGAWEEQKRIREVMVFLHSHDISSAYATKIFKKYGERSVEVVKENPYRLADDIFGVGFLTADKIAQKMGFSRESALRAESGVVYVLNQLSADGHLYYPAGELVEKCCEILEVEKKAIRGALDNLAGENKVVIEEVKGEEAVYLKKYHVCEGGIASRVKEMSRGRGKLWGIDKEKAIEWVQKQSSIKLARKQKDAVMRAADSKVTVITGGPGTGKTTIISSVIRIFEKANMNIMLAAPTGRAAKKMSESTGRKAGTIHRMLKYSIAKGGFQKNEKNKLHCDLLIVDEASMIDAVLMHHLMKAVPLDAAFVLVGDVNQLPSVGAGSVLRDVIESSLVPVIKLDKIFRQAKESMIVVNAHRINSGRMPVVSQERAGLSDFYFIRQDDPEKTVDIIIRLARERIPRRFGFDPVKDIQVLTPMHKGTAGSANLNKRLQEALNPRGRRLQRGGWGFRVNDKVMQVRNNYDKEVYNGDTGRITGVENELGELSVSFDSRIVKYEYSEMDEIVPAYAISIHKSQGSEYPAVIVPILTQHYILLQRNLIYTAVTRGKKLVVLVGTKKALAIGIRNNKTTRRNTFLKERLKNTRAESGMLNLQ